MESFAEWERLAAATACRRVQDDPGAEHRDRPAGGVGAGPARLRSCARRRFELHQRERIVFEPFAGHHDVQVADVVGLAIVEQVDAIREGDVEPPVS